ESVMSNLLHTGEIVLLYAGILLFVACVSLLVFFAFRKENPPKGFYKTLQTFMLLSVVMIGFPAIKSVQIGNIVVDLVRTEDAQPAQPSAAYIAELTSLRDQLLAYNLDSLKVITDRATSIIERETSIGDTLKRIDQGVSTLQIAVGKEDADIALIGDNFGQSATVPHVLAKGTVWSPPLGITKVLVEVIGHGGKGGKGF